MKKHLNLIRILTVILLFSLLAGCGEYHSGLTDPNETTGGEETTIGKENLTTEDEFSVSLTYAGSGYVPKIPMSAKWTGDSSVHEAAFGEDGTAKISGLDGDYQVTLTNLPKGYTYNPNIYIATNNSKHVTIELYKAKTSKRGGEDLYQAISISELGVYRTELTSTSHIVYYEFKPMQSGTYTVESWVDITENKVNPLYDAYKGTVVAKYFSETVDGGGISSTYTKNFKYTVNVTDAMIGNVYTFGLRVESEDSNFPVTVDFALQLNGGFGKNETKTDLVLPKDLYEINFEAVEALKSGSKLNGCEKLMENGRYRFDDTDYGYDENLGCYRKKDPVTGELTGPVLYAYITTPCRFIDTPFTTIEYAGNKALTVSNGAENYKLFIEGYSAICATSLVHYFCNANCPCLLLHECEGACLLNCPNCLETCRNVTAETIGAKGYADYANEDGLVPVTEELKQFLQKLAVSEKYFWDGNGYVEEHPLVHVEATEPDMWLFACTYYS